jgi:hypothetical protein
MDSITPMKSAKIMNDAMQTPENINKHRVSFTNASGDSLSKTFSGMKIHNLGGTLKRAADLMTVEGTPVNITKRIDLNPTPNLKIPPGTYPVETSIIDYTRNNSSIQVNHNSNNDIVNANGDRNNRDRHSSKINISETGRKVLCISSGSDDHDTGEHQENALRTALICGDNGCLRRPQLDESIVWVDEELVKPAPIADLLRVHEYTYLNHLENKCKTSSERQNLQGFDSCDQESNSSGIPHFYAPSGYLDIDTPLVPQSLNASRRFCGAAMLAVDLLMKCSKNDYNEPSSIISHAFILGRPPGHHAGPSGCVPSKHYWKRPDMTSSGFCLLNTVAVAAAYARYRYGRYAYILNNQFIFEFPC